MLTFLDLDLQNNPLFPLSLPQLAELNMSFDEVILYCFVGCGILLKHWKSLNSKLEVS